MKPQRQSIRATYDSRNTGPQYHVTTRLGDRTIIFQQPTDDPFVSMTVQISWRDVFRELLHGHRVRVTVMVGGHPDRIADVLELDDNTLTSNSTRRATFDSHINESLGRLAGGRP